jgi:type I restriction enzyme S subunit
LIELLKEKRQAVISHAVTKGLDPDAPMKDSGVEWLGEIPAHWGVARLGYYAHVTNGSTPSKAVREYWSDGDIPWASSGDLNQYHIESPSGNITSKALLECSLSIVPAGSVLIGMVGQGKTRGLSALLKVDSTINQNVAAVACDGRLDSIFLHFILQSIYKSLREYGRGGNQAALNCEIVSSIRFPLPDRQEQKNIAQVLELKLGKIAMVMEQAEKQIELLQERRTALISAAVTGKIDVREAV